jgi:hypothetical protein
MLNIELLSPAEPPKHLVDRFKAVDDRLGLKFVQFPIADSTNVNSIRHWAIVMNWREDDKRREWIQRGEMPASAAFDVLGYLPIDCSVHEAFTYFERMATGQLRDGRDVEKLVSRLHLFNADVKKDIMKPVMDKAEELIEDNVGTLFAAEGKTIPKVVLSGKPLPADMSKKGK